MKKSETDIPRNRATEGQRGRGVGEIGRGKTQYIRKAIERHHACHSIRSSFLHTVDARHQRKKRMFRNTDGANSHGAEGGPLISAAPMSPPPRLQP